MSASAPTETELKLRLAPDAAARIARHPAIAAVKRARATSGELVGIYFDTPDGRLAHAGIALRVRREGARWVQALKGPARPSDSAGLSTRAELQWTLPPSEGRPPLDLSLLQGTPWEKPIAKAVQNGPLAPRLTSAFRRTTVPLRFADGTLALLAIDVGTIRAEVAAGRRRQLPLCELEIELESGNASCLFELALALSANVPLGVESRSKAERGYALLRGTHTEPFRAEPVELPAHCTGAQALAIIIGNCVRQIEANARMIAEGGNPEHVHQARVGVRRLRSCLQLARRYVPAEPLTTIEGELRWFANALGPARDLDVLLDETLPPLLAEGKRGHGRALTDAVAPLHAGALKRRRAARLQARAAVRAARLQQLLLHLGSFCATPDFGASPDENGVVMLVQPATTLARAVLKRRYRKLMDLGSKLAEATTAERHNVRIAAKRLRYAIEFFGSLYPRKRVRALAKSLVRLQDVLGRDNDAQVALTLATEITGNASTTTAALAGWAAAQSVGHQRESAEAWERLVACEAFWDRTASAAGD